MASIFTRIVNGDIPSWKIAESDDFYAFLDINPLAKGQTLVIPKQEVDYVCDVDDDLLGRLMVFAKGVAKALEQVVPCARIGVAVIGLEVPHCHIHLVPINNVGDIDFSKPKLEFSKEEMQATAQAIQAAYNG